MSYKITIRISEPTSNAVDEQGQASTLTQDEKHEQNHDVDPRIEEVLAHARELASTWQPDVTYQPDTTYKKVPISRKNMRKTRTRLRDIFLTSFSIALTLGAILLVFVHTLAPSAPMAQPAVSVSVPTVTSSDRQIELQLTKPAFSTWIYEAGIYSTLASAKSAVQDYRASGVQPVIAPLIASAGAGAKGRYTLLLGSTIAASGSKVYTTWLNHAQVPYFIRPWILKTLTVKFRQAVPVTMQTLLSTDVKMLEALIAISSGYEVTTIDTLAVQREKLRQQINLANIRKTGAQRNILRFDHAILNAWQAQHSAGPYGTMLQVAKAIASYTQVQ